TGVTRRRRKLDRRAEAHGNALATRTRHLHRCKVPGEIILCEQWTNLWPGASDNVHALRRPVGHPWTGHVAQVDIELQQARGFLQLLGKQFYDCMLRLIGWTDYHLPDDFAIQIHSKMLLKAVEGFGAAFAAVASVFVLDRNAPVGRDVLLEPSSTRSTSRV